jgi:hypothetical protein
MPPKKKPAPWKIVATSTDKPDVVVDAQHIEFHTPEGRRLCRISALPDGRIEFRSLADQLTVEPVNHNLIYLELLMP